MINDHIKDLFFPSFMKCTLKILPASCSVPTEVDFLLCPIDHSDRFPDIKSLFHS